MSDCTRFEDEGILAYERGEPLEGHYASCSACKRAIADYEALASDIAEAGAKLAPRPDFEARVWSAIARRRESKAPWWHPASWRGRRFALVAAAALAAAALLTVWLARPDDGRATAVIALHQEILPATGAAPSRGDSARPNDIAVLRATTGGARTAELRVYFGTGRGSDELLLRCSDQPPCKRSENQIVAELTLPRRGDYHCILAVSDGALPAPTQSLDGDIASIEAAGGMVERGPTIRAR